MNRNLALALSLGLLLGLGGCANLKVASKSSSSLTSFLGFSELPDWYITSRYSYSDSRWIKNDFGMDIHYRDIGEGPVVLMIHGEMDSLHMWEQWSETLSSNFRVIALDLPGSGLTGATHCIDDIKSTCQENLTSDYLKHTLHYFIEDLQLTELHIVAASYGAYLAMDYALKNPDRVEKMVLAAPAGFQQSVPSSMTWLAGPSLLTRYYQPSLLVTSIVRDFYSEREPRPTEVKRYLHLAQSDGMHASNIIKLKLVEEIMEHGSTLDFSALNTETLVLWGEQDKWSSSELAERWKETLPQSTLVTYPKLGHAFMNEQAEITVADVAAYFLGDPLPSIEGLGIEGSFTIDEAAGELSKEELFGGGEEAETQEMQDEP